MSYNTEGSDAPLRIATQGSVDAAADDPLLKTAVDARSTTGASVFQAMLAVI